MQNDNVEKPGATGEFPDGKINKHDEGELKIAIAADTKNGIVVLDFGKPTTWIGLRPNEVYGLIKINVNHPKK